MSLIFDEQLDGQVLMVKASGKLNKEDYDRFGPLTEQLIQRFGKIRVFFEMHDFHGWDMGGMWEEIKFEFKHFKDIERLAIVGETSWEQGMAIFCRAFTTATIHYYDHEHEQDALDWVYEGLMVEERG